MSGSSVSSSQLARRCRRWHAYLALETLAWNVHRRQQELLRRRSLPSVPQDRPWLMMFLLASSRDACGVYYTLTCCN
jgi:hypothetical protein